jgi:peptidyl-dipeptidase Dcp
LKSAFEEWNTELLTALIKEKNEIEIPFKETSLFDQATAQSFRKNILEKGGTEDPMTLYKRFRGREPKVEPLLKRKGFLQGGKG